MSVSVRCPGCAASLKASERLYGKTVQCPRCQAEVTVLYPKITEAGPRAVPQPASAQVEAPPASLTETPDGGYALAPTEPNPSYSAPPPAVSPAEVPMPRRRRRRERDEEKRSFSSEDARRWVTIGVGVAAFLLLFGGGYLAVQYGLRMPPPPVTPEAQWQVVEVPGRFKVRLPGPSQRQTQQASGISMVMHLCSAEKDSLYGVGYMEGELPAHRRNLPDETLLNDACNGSLANVPGAQEVSRTSVQLGEFPGKQLVMYIPRGHGNMISRAFLAHGHLYVVMAGGTGLEPDHPNVKKLFDSFEILDTGAPPPAQATPSAPAGPAPIGQPKPPDGQAKPADDQTKPGDDQAKPPDDKTKPPDDT